MKKRTIDSFKLNCEPTNSPWHEVQCSEKMCPGVFWVSTAGHGGVMVCEEIAPSLFSLAARRVGFAYQGYLCFEEDCDAAVPMLELLEKKLWAPSWHNDTEAYMETLKQSIKCYLPNYWRAWKRRRKNISGVDSGCDIIAKEIMRKEARNGPYAESGRLSGCHQ